MMRQRAIFTALIVTVAASLVCGQDKRVYFSFIVSNGEYGYRSSGAVPSIDLALEAVQDLQILPGYNLTYETVRNSKCTRTNSLDAFFGDTQSAAVPKIAVIGCGCSIATEPVAEISHHWNISQISFAAGLSTLSDRSRFRYYFRTTPTTTNYAPAILGVLNNFRWRRLAFITLNHNLFVQILGEVEELQQSVREGTSKTCCFNNHNVVIESSFFDVVGGDPVAAAREIFETGIFHVFLVNCYSKFARHVICEASKRNLVYPHYGWIMFGWYPERWWTEEVAGEHIDECTDEEMEEFLKKAQPLLINLVPEPDDYNLQTDAGFSSQEFIDEYKTRVWPNSAYNLSTIYLMAFDAMWSVAQMLNYTEDMRLRNLSMDHPDFDNCRHLDGGLVPLDKFDYNNSLMGCIMRDNYYKINFTGVSGPIRYAADGTIFYTRIRLAQWREVNGELATVRFGYLDRDSNFSLVYDPGESDETLYPEEYPPDGTPVSITHTYHTALVVCYYFLAICGIILSGICLVFNFAYRKKKVIRLTAPLLNYAIVCGAFLMYVSVFFGVLPTVQKALIHMQCIVHVWVYGIGYLLVYGTILAKMWRVYQIFHDPNPNKLVLKTWHLMCVVGIITGLGVLLILAETIVQAVTSPHLVTDAENPQGMTSSSVLEEYSVWQCYESGSVLFIFDLLIFVYLGLLQLVGIILAFQTRKVKIPILNDSKSVTALIYLSSIVLVVIVLITFILRGYINVSAAVFSGGIILLATFFLALSFIPKAMSLYHDPTGDKIFSEMHPTKQSERSQIKDHHNSMAAGMAELKDAEKVVLLNSHLTSLKETVKDKNRRITELEAIIKSST